MRGGPRAPLPPLPGGSAGHREVCLGCGTSVAQGHSAPRPPAPPSPEPEVGRPGERRQLTVLFCDLVGSTPLAQQLDAEDWRDVLAQYHAAASCVVARWGGHVAKNLGDGLLIYFGWPSAHEDDPERAVRAGLAILEAMAPQNAAHGTGDGTRLAVRIGMDTGPVVIADGGEVFGETANVAAHVQSVAEPDTVVITAATQRLVAGIFVVEDRGPQALKGVREPLTLYRVVQPSGVRSRLAVAAGRLTPFVGREVELTTLLERWEQARDGEGQVVLITGEAGIGKSRLVHEFRTALSGTPHSWVEAAGSAYHQHSPFYVVSDLLRQAFAWQREESADVRLDALASALELAGLNPADSAPLVAPLLGLPVPPERFPPPLLSPEQQRKRLMATVVAWTVFAARAQPTILVTEDLHWVDPSTLELLGRLVEQGATAPLLLLCTARPDFRAPWPMRAHHAQLTLARLNQRDVREMIARLTPQLVPPEPVVETLVARTDGVPLFVEELTRAVLEAAGASIATREIPSTLQDSLMARLDQLGAAKDVAQIASVIGREFSYELLREVVGAQRAALLREDDLHAALAKLGDAKLVYARGVPPEATYTFKHALIQETAYESLLKRRRRELHRAIAAALSEKFAAIAETQPEVVAQHWEAAGEAERALVAWEQAAGRARHRAAFAEAARQYARALAVLEMLPDTPTRAQQELLLQLAFGLMVIMTHGVGAAETARALARAQALSTQLGDMQQLIAILLVEVVNTFGRGETRAAQVLAEQLVVATRQDGGTFARTWAEYLAAVCAFLLGDLDAAIVHGEQAMSLYRPEDHRGWPADPAVLARSIVSYVAWQQGRAVQAAEWARRGVTLNERAESPSQRHVGAVALLHTFALLRDPDAIVPLAEVVLGAKSANTHALPQTRIIRGWAQHLQGESDAGIGELRQGIDEYVATGTRASLGLYLGWLAEAQLLAGHVAEAGATITVALDALPEEQVFIPELLRLRGDWLMAESTTPNPQSAEASYREAIALAVRLGVKMQELRAVTSLGRLLRSLGRAAEARDLLAPLYAAFTEGFDTRDLKDAKALLDELR
jgi:class 3 adenylate cyclase/predicted ATPase